MAANKTTENQNSVIDFLKTIPDESKRMDCAVIIDLITQNTGIQPKMWGKSIVGFGSYHYQYESGHSGDAPLAGLASRVNAITFYVGDFENKDSLLEKLGKYKTGKGCIYIKKLEDVNSEILIQIFSNSIHRKN
jgi:hypothetical protein